MSKSAWEECYIMGSKSVVEEGCERIIGSMSKIGYNGSTSINDITVEEYDELINIAKSMVTYLEELKLRID